MNFLTKLSNSVSNFFKNDVGQAATVISVVVVGIAAVLGLLILQAFITAGNFQGTVGTLIDILPIVVAGLALIFGVVAMIAVFGVGRQ